MGAREPRRDPWCLHEKERLVDSTGHLRVRGAPRPRMPQHEMVTGRSFIGRPRRYGVPRLCMPQQKLASDLTWASAVSRKLVDGVMLPHEKVAHEAASHKGIVGTY
ncbi:hypothetical protein TorRG33x02_115420 [Trema orientale]|uniref:Uncharacterized protein n=1 Tax=Trema orientale TaxID=63057 RepID=A0A2P5F4H9_TREOI|nr:hypothetical protein TorRG33x02_115420 [Trema orientale]